MLLALVPKLSLDIPVLFGGPLDSPGTLGLLALCLVFAGVALTYDLLFGFTGLLSFGHALYFALGVYLTTIALTKWEWSLVAGRSRVTAIAGILVPLLLGAISLRVGGIAFAMVTLAFAQAGQVLVQKNPDELTGGEEGLGLNFEPLPDFFVGVLNTKNLYWLALGYAVVVFLVVRWAVSSSPGPRLAGDPRERAPGRGDRPAAVRVQADRVRARLVPLHDRRDHLAARARNGREPAGDDRQLHSHVARDGRDRRRRHEVRRAARRLPLHAARPAARRARGLLAGAGSADRHSKAALGALFILGTLFILLVFFVPGGLAGLGRRVRVLRRSAGLRGDAMKIAWERHGAGRRCC